jgi:uncharacterized protein (DUF2141 family)
MSFRYLTLMLMIFVSTRTFAFNLFVLIETSELIENNIKCALFNENLKESFPKKYEQAILLDAMIENKKIMCKFENIPYGNYAVSIYNDENKNNKLDLSFFGIPKEDWGVSNNVRHKMSSPYFEESQILINKDVEISIKLGNL